MKHFFTSAAFLIGGMLLAGAAAPQSMTRGTDAPGEVITAPEGEAVPFTKTFDGFFLNMVAIESFQGNTVPTEMVLGDDGYFYIKDIVSMVPTESYVKGEFTEEEKLQFTFPQTIYKESDEDYGDMWMDVSLVYSSNVDEEPPVPVTENNVITFSMNEDGTEFYMDPLPEGTSLAVVIYPEGMWFGFSETSMTLTMGSGDDKEGVTPPEGVEIVKYSYIYDNSLAMGEPLPDGRPDFGYHVNVAFDGNDVYLGGLFHDARQSWVKGRLEGDKVVVPGKQYVGTMSGVMDFYLMYCKWATEAHDKLELLPADTEFTFLYDKAAGTLKASDKDVMMLLNMSDTEVRALQLVEDPVYIFQPDASGAPMAPWGLKYTERSTSAVFEFHLPVVTDSGVLLYTDDMYYNIYVDGELLEFYAEENSDFEEDTTDIPYTMNANSVVRETYSSWHELIVPVLGAQTVGVQCVNVWGGEKYFGPLMILDVASGQIQNSVEGISEGSYTSTCYDLAGRRISGDAKGMRIVRRTYADGTVKVVKEMAR